MQLYLRGKHGGVLACTDQSYIIWPIGYMIHTCLLAKHSMHGGKLSPHLLHGGNITIVCSGNCNRRVRLGSN